MTPRRQYALVLAVLGVTAVAALASLGQVWIVARAGGAGLPVVEASLQGGRLVPGATGAAVMLLAGVAGVIATRGWGRRLLGAVLALAAGGMGVAAGGFGLGLPASARPAVVAETGFEDVTIVASSWWLVVVGAATLAAAAALVVVVGGARWPVLGGRYERGPATPNGTPTNPAAMTPAQAWDALDRGEDPTTAAEVTE